MKRALLALALVAGCESSPSPARAPERSKADSCEASLDAEFQAFASTRGSCGTAAECSIVQAECPLTSVAVRWTQADGVVAERDRLVQEAARRGSCSACPDRAAPPALPSCVDGHCELALPTLDDGR